MSTQPNVKHLYSFHLIIFVITSKYFFYFSELSVEDRKKAIVYLFSASRNIAKAINNKFIDPLSLSNNIVLHSYGGSRLASQLFTAVQPAGSYKTMLNLIAQLATDTPKFPLGHIAVAFDNQQIVGRDYRVTLGATQPVSVVTTLIVFAESINHNMQQIPVPTSLNLTTQQQKLTQAFKTQCITAKNIHNKYRTDWIKARLTIAVKESDKSGLDDCAASIKAKTYESGLEYDRVPRMKSSCTITDMENLMMNPNSYDTVIKVLTTITEMSEASDPNRKWITVYCDGQPYNLASKVIDSHELCSTCGASGKNLKCKNLPDHVTRPLFDKIVLRPG